MHFEILVEGQCELTALSILMPKIVGFYGEPHTWKIHKHRGIGRIPESPQDPPNLMDNTLLHQLPAKLRAYSKTPSDDRVVIVLLDLDDKNLVNFKAELNTLLLYCEDGFNADFCFAVEELESWYLGDKNALLSYKPTMKLNALSNYVQDSVCGTWELLAGVDDPTVLSGKKRSPQSLNIKKEWSKKIPVYMDVNSNASPSFNEFVEQVRAYT